MIVKFTLHFAESTPMVKFNVLEPIKLFNMPLSDIIQQ